MSNLYISSLIQPTENSVDIEINRISLSERLLLTVEKYSTQGELIGTIIPPTTYVENGGCPEDKTRIRVFLNDGQVGVGEKIKIKLDN